MPRRSKGARLYLRRREGSEPYWVIRDGCHEELTGCSERDDQKAERKLAQYIAEKYEPPTQERQLAKLRIPDLINIYLTERTPHVARPDFLLNTATPILDWWGHKKLTDVRAKTCQDYVTWRCKQGVSDQTARHDLKTLRAAIRYYHANTRSHHVSHYFFQLRFFVLQSFFRAHQIKPGHFTVTGPWPRAWRRVDAFWKLAWHVICSPS